MAVFGDAVQSISGSKIIGRYFTVVSFIPSTVFTTYFLVLKRSGAWSRTRIDLSAAITSLDLKDAVALGFGGLLLALALHPMQYTLVQVFEGYWGQSWLAVRAATLCTLRHRKRWLKLHDASGEHLLRTEKLRQEGKSPPAETANAGFSQMTEYISAVEQSRIFGYYPQRIELLMPTRLGNVLRMHEANAGRIYELNALTIVPRLMLTADPKHVDYVQDQRTNLDLAVRTSALSLAAAAMTLTFMARHGWWMLLALAPCVVAYTAYRGSVRAAFEYGLAVMMLIEFNRFVLYEKLHLKLPDTLGAEKAVNKQLAVLFSANALIARPNARLRYEHPKPGTAITPQPAASEPPPGPQGPGRPENAAGAASSASTGSDMPTGGRAAEPPSGEDVLQTQP